jgi:hypothetical protein
VDGKVTIRLRGVLETINDITSLNPALTHVRRHRFRGNVKHVKVVGVGVRTGAHEIV